MTVFRLILRSLVFHGRMNLAVALGVAAATAVLTGALLVGDSVRGSLRRLTLDRLGRIDELLVVDRFFREEVAGQVSADRDVQSHYASVVPAILVPSATAETQSAETRRRASGVTLIGSTDEFWKLGNDEMRPRQVPRGDEVVLNAPLAAELNARPGDTIILRLAKAAQIPADSPLGEKSNRITSLAELKVVDVIAAESLGRFSLHPTQVAPKNAYLSLATLQQALDVAGQINCLLVAGKSSATPPDEVASRTLAKSLLPSLADFGLALKEVHIRQGAGNAASDVAHYFSLTSDRMMLDDATAAAALRALAELQPQPVLTYLANDMVKVQVPSSKVQSQQSGERGGNSPAVDEVRGQRSEAEVQSLGIPYSMITAVDPAPGGPLVDHAGSVLPPLADDEIVLNAWAAKDQQVQPGDTVRVTWFEPETTHGQEQETSAEFRVKSIVPLTEPAVPYSRRRSARYDQPPTPANDPDLTPTVKGITDQESIENWNAPFEYDRARIRSQDDQYWRNHRTTPKAFVSLATGQRLWGSRFGRVTSIRIPAGKWAATEIESELVAELHRRNAELGFAFQPIKRQGLAASSGTTPFDVLFLLLSVFIIAAALMLVWLLFRLGVEQRASEIGLLQSLGWSAGKSARLLLVEGGIVAAVGGLAGVAGGIGYAWLMLAGLRTWWVGAIATPFLQLHVTSTSMMVGFLLGVLVSLLTIWLSLRLLTRVPPKQLLAGVTQIQPRGGSAADPRPGRLGSWLAAALFIGAVALAAAASTLGGEGQAGAFLGAGASFLAAMLLLIRRRLAHPSSHRAARSMTALAMRNAGRNAGRSLATIALMASASFLIVAVSSFRLEPTDEGIGGFDLIAESSEPILHDLNSQEGRQELLAREAAKLDGSTVLAFRVKPGDDASCRNLYQPSQPRILGVTPAMIRYFDDLHVSPRFAFAASAAKSPEEKANPWRVLNVERNSFRSNDRLDPTNKNGMNSVPPDESIPVVLDKNTAMYSLKLYFGIGERFSVTYADGRTIKFRVAGLLSNSVLQGSLLIGEADFRRLFPQVSGYRSFLIKTPPGKRDAVAAALEERLGDEGFDASDSRARLADLLAVQNTYISTFQSLGALGLVLGTFGLAAVQLRNVLERRKELALMRAVGFRGMRLGEMVLLENLFLLLAGLACGTLAALASVVPHMLAGGARVPLSDLGIMLGIVLTVGIITGLIAVRATLRAPILSALRGS